MRFKYLSALILPVLLAFGIPAHAQDINVEKIKRQILSECGSGAKAGPKFPTTADFDGDGKPDYIFDYSEATGCSGFCGSAGCTVDIYLSRIGEKPAFSDNLRAWSIKKAKGKDLLELGLHGSACGRVGAAECRKTLGWNGQKFVLASAAASTPSSGTPKSWKLVEGRGEISAITRNQAGSAQLTLSCLFGTGIRTLSLSMQGVPRGWRAGSGGDYVTATIGGEHFELIFQGSYDYSAVSLRGYKNLEAPPQFLTALRTNPTLVLTGQQVARSPERERTFPIGQNAALARVEQACR